MDISAFLAYCIIVTFTPGPTNVIILSLVQDLGTHRTLRFVFGATTAFGSLLTMSALLNSTLDSVLPKYLQVMRVLGSLYISYLAFKIFFANAHNISSREKAISATFLNGFLLQFINPKVILFTMTVIPSFVLPFYNTRKMLSIFVLIIMIIGLMAFNTWVIFGSIFKKFLTKYQNILNKVMALFLVYSAILTSGVKEFIFR
ncbi:MAG: LysE family translocator [Pleomorphochaeta sp.]